MALYREINGELVQWKGEAIDGVIYPPEIEDLWKSDRLNAVGLIRPAPAAPVSGDFEVTGITVVKTGEMTAQYVLSTEARVITTSDVNAERDRRLLEGSVFTPTGHDRSVAVGGDDTTAKNLQGLAFAAQLRLAQGDTTHVTKYRDENNEYHNLVPGQVLDLWSQGVAWIEAVLNASWVIKETEGGIPADFKDDTHWPQ